MKWYQVTYACGVRDHVKRPYRPSRGDATAHACHNPGGPYCGVVKVRDIEDVHLAPTTIASN